MMKELIEEVRDLVQFEYQRAAVKFGTKNNSDHESYAILLEEREESQFECKGVDLCLSLFWDMCKENASDDKKIETCYRLQNRAILAACELIQVAAMAAKAAITIESRSEGGDAL